MTAPRRSGTEQANIRGGIVLVVAVVVGLAFLMRSNGLVGPTAAGKSKPSATTTTVVGGTTTPSTVVKPNTGVISTPTGTAHTPSQVKVLVINASGLSGIGATNRTTLTGAQFDVTDVKNGPGAPIAATTIWYAPGYQADAAAVKVVVKQPTAVIAALPATPILAEASQNNVTVAFGKDYKS